MGAVPVSATSSPAGARLDELTATDVAGRAARLLLAVPLGATEQHGPHLPLGTDTTIAAAVAAGLADRRRDVVIAPPLPYGSSGEHAGFDGTLSIGQHALEHLVVELVRSADAFAGVVLVSGHAGNAEALGRAARLLASEGRMVEAWWPVDVDVDGRAADAHAGWAETSVLLALDPAHVDLQRAEPGDTRPLADIGPELRGGGVAAVSPNGVLGDPAGASAEAGAAVLAALVDDLARRVATRFGAVR